MEGEKLQNEEMTFFFWGGSTKMEIFYRGKHFTPGKK